MTGLEQRMDRMREKLYAAETIETLTPEDWEKICTELSQLADDAAETYVYASSIYQRMIGG